MIVLGLDTATTATVAGVLDASGTVVEVRDDPEPGVRPAHANRLLAAAEEALERAGLGWDEVERIAVGVGPGSFTGLRIGIATARALAQARGLPLVAVSSLEALARGAGTRELVLAVLDARRGEAFAAAWRGGDARAAAPARARAGGARGAGRARCRDRRWPWGTGRYASGDRSRRPGRSSRPTKTAPTASAPSTSAGWARRGIPPTATHSCPTTCASPTPYPASDDHSPSALEIRRLTYADLPQVVAIERRAFPTPWSLAMFVLELSKPGGDLPGRVRRRRDARLPDLLALRHGLAPDERLGRPRPPPRGDRDRRC